MIRCVLIFLLFISIPIYSEDFETLLEKYFGNRTPSSTNYFDISQLQDLYNTYSKDPLNINKSKLKDLIILPLVSENYILELLESAPYTNEFELIDKINSLNTEEIFKKILRDCLTIKTERKNANSVRYTNRYKNILQNKDGFQREKYLGSPTDLYQKLNLIYNDFELNTILDKDAGERYINDFTSFSLKYDKQNFKIIVGDYNLSFGLGSVYDQSFLSLKSSDFINTAVDYGGGAEMNRSTIENNFFRGVYGEYYLSRYFRVSSFYSNRNIAATINKSTDIATSVYTSGYFRTETEISKVGALNEQVSGMNIEYNSRYFSFGLLSTYLDYSKEIMSSSFAVFSGQKGFNNSFYGAYNRPDETIKFEIGQDANNNFSFRANYYHKISNDITFLTDFRSSGSDYRAPYANNFGEQSFLANERGIISGIAFNHNNFAFSLFTDIYGSEIKTFTTQTPMTGIQYFADFRLKAGKEDYGFRINYEKKSASFKVDKSSQKLTAPNNKLNFRFDINSNLGGGFNFRARTELKFVINDIFETEKGGLILLEIKKRDNNLNLYYGLSYLTFNTSSFESVIYGFQYQVPGLAYVYPFYKKGNNLSGFVKYDISENFDFWLRFNHLYKNNNDNIGTGYEEIIGNMRTQFVLQIQFKLI